jgi:methylated-DNA-[protein]-cysteine S-methyltransferase
MYTCTIETPLGVMQAAAEDAGLRGLWFLGQKYYPAGTDTWISAPDYGVFPSLRAWLEAYFARQRPPITIPLAPMGTDFQQSVWKRLQEIPYGDTLTYGTLAVFLGKASRSAQAIGGAVGHNPISILIPCHRVLGARGGLRGYAGGLERKRSLLILEGARNWI